MQIEKLMRLGLNKNEAKVYLSLLIDGASTASHVIKKTEFHRNIVYDNLEKLIDKGLVSFIREGNAKIFSACSPESIVAMTQKEQEVLDEKKKLATQVKEDIDKLIRVQDERQDATIYRGSKGIKLVLLDTLRCGKDYQVFGAPKASVEIMGETFWKNYNIKREEKNIRIKMIFNKELKTWSKKIASPLTQIRFLPKRFDTISETMIYANKVAIIVWSEKPIVTLIEDAQLAESYNNYFSLMWQQAGV